jgi:hypothetical protein
VKPELQREALCKACGWKEPPPLSTLCGWKDARGTAMLSDPLDDLNAMHEAEKTLQWVPDDEYCGAARYYEQLVFVCGNRSDPPDVYEWHLFRATATQRAEAFLRTLGLWIEYAPGAS